MKIKPEDISTTYYAEGGEILLGVSIQTATGFALYKPLDEKHTDWERLASSKNPIDFDNIIFGKPPQKKIPKAKLAKNNIEEIVPKNTEVKETKAKSKVPELTSAKKVKKSFL